MAKLTKEERREISRADKAAYAASQRNPTPSHGFKFTVENPANPCLQMFLDWHHANEGKQPMQGG